MLRRPPNSLNAKDVTILKLRVLSIKENTKTGTLNNLYVLINKINKAAGVILYIFYLFYSAK